jgi:hypothetical protein
MVVRITAIITHYYMRRKSIPVLSGNGTSGLLDTYQ